MVVVFILFYYFNKEHRDSSLVIFRGMDNVFEWLGATTTNSDFRQPPTTHDNHNQWQPSTTGLLDKCNVDASYNHNSDFIGVGWILCDVSGVYKLFASSKLKQGTNSLEAEGIILLHAIQSLYCRGYRNIIMEGDCKELTDLLYNRIENASMNPLLIDILSWADYFSFISFTTVLRQCNQVADKLTKNAQNLIVTSCT